MPLCRTQRLERWRNLSFSPPSSLVRREKECFVLFDWETNRSAEEISFVIGNTLREPVGSVQSGVTQELKHASVYSVCSRFNDLVDYAPGSASVFCFVIVGKDFEFRNRIRIRVD